MTGYRIPQLPTIWSFIQAFFYTSLVFNYDIVLLVSI